MGWFTRKTNAKESSNVNRGQSKRNKRQARQQSNATRTGSDTSVASERAPLVTRTGEAVTTKKVYKLSTRAEMEKMRDTGKLPPDYIRILEGTFSEMSEVTPHLFLTGIFGLSKENFEKNKITKIINTTFEAPELVLPGVTHERVVVDDDTKEDLLPVFDKVADSIHSETQRGGHTVVHCIAGVSRSTAFALAYLIKHQNMTLKDAFKKVQKARKVIKPNPSFMSQLINYERKIRGSTSTKMVKVERNGVFMDCPDFYVTDCPQLLNELFNNPQIAANTEPNANPNRQSIGSTNKRKSRKRNK